MDTPGLKQVLDFVKAARAQNLGSTGAEVVELADKVYNVIGSKDDPKRVPDHFNENWKPLFISLTGIENAKCYVKNDPDASQHPKFQVGGHVTTNSDGKVKKGGTCYLMPMCKSHNGHDGVEFTHDEDVMLELSGFMEGELPVTFMLRLPNQHPYALLYYAEAEQTWKVQDYAEEHQDKWQSGLVGQETPGLSVAVHRVDSPEGTLHKVVSARLPGLA